MLTAKQKRHLQALIRRGFTAEEMSRAAGVSEADAREYRVHVNNPDHQPEEAPAQQRATLTPEDVTVIRNRIVSGENMRNIAADYGVTYTTITRIKKGQTWQNVPLTPFQRQPSHPEFVMCPREVQEIAEPYDQVIRDAEVAKRKALKQAELIRSAQQTADHLVYKAAELQRQQELAI